MQHAVRAQIVWVWEGKFSPVIWFLQDGYSDLVNTSKGLKLQNIIE